MSRHEATWSHDEFRGQAREAVSQFSRRPVDPAIWDSFARGLFHSSGQFEKPEGYKRLADLLTEVDRERCTGGNRVFYLAVQPSAYSEIVERLGKCSVVNGRQPENGWARVIVEKPFGHDLESARALNAQVATVFREDQVYRIDHYLGKETVRNILVFRFANGIFEPVWNRRYIDHVQISAAESIGVGNRAGYYEEAGALRDMVQNHMLQLLALVAMEPPIAFSADAVHNEKVKVLQAIRPVSGEEVPGSTIRGQYGPGWVDGREVLGYRQEEGVDPNSSTETYVALKLLIDNWRWADVPFYLRTGKRLPKRSTEIAIYFKRAPLLLFSGMDASLEPNVLTIRIQPNEGISLKFHAKEPGMTVRIRSVNMDFLYGASFAVQPPSAYETLLLDCLEGDSTLFARRDEVESAWAFITAILEGWLDLPKPAFPNYEAGTWGPDEAKLVLERDSRSWRRP
ncbi:MAG: glucose-6-phosphate dehydrogenase [Chloroflexi bacterium]|nr:glucose-6-phosphate dehydrogenase [Chloroflexota bacterium]